MEQKKGVSHALTASRSEMSSFGNSWMQAMIASFPQRLAGPFPKGFIKNDSLEDASARVAPYGLRKIETMMGRRTGKKTL